MRKLSGYMTDLGYPDPEKCVFSFNSEHTGEISTRFVESKDLSVCIMNIQAFNRATNRLRAEDEYGQVLWEDICAVRPAVMVDEPCRIEGSGYSSKSLEAMKELNPLFTMRFESEPWKECNKIFSFPLKQALAEGAVRASLAAVSYTHLDVYKRQLPSSRLRRRTEQRANFFPACPMRYARR